MINMSLISSQAYLHFSSNSNFVSFSSNLHSGLDIFEKSFMNLLENPTCPKKLLIPFTMVGGKRVSMMETLAWSTSNQTTEISLPKTMPSVTMK